MCGTAGHPAGACSSSSAARLRQTALPHAGCHQLVEVIRYAFFVAVRHTDSASASRTAVLATCLQALAQLVGSIATPLAVMVISMLLWALRCAATLRHPQLVVIQARVHVTRTDASYGRCHAPVLPFQPGAFPAHVFIMLFMHRRASP